MSELTIRISGSVLALNDRVQPESIEVDKSLLQNMGDALSNLTDKVGNIVNIISNPTEIAKMIVNSTIEALKSLVVGFINVSAVVFVCLALSGVFLRMFGIKKGGQIIQVSFALFIIFQIIGTIIR